MDVNLLGWSQSIPRLSESMYEAILDLVEAAKLIPTNVIPGETDYFVDDRWGKTKIRRAVHGFSEEVLADTESHALCAVHALRRL